MKGSSRLRLAAAALAGTMLAEAASAAVIVHTAPFIKGGFFNGFEGTSSPRFGNYPGNTHSEGGLTVSYVGLAPRGIYNGEEAEGLFGWFPNGGGFGYTRITPTEGGDLNAIQFLARSGSRDPSDLFVQYELLFEGLEVASGSVGGLNFDGGGPFTYVGFSGVTFDEVRLRSLITSWKEMPAGLETLQLDSIAAANMGAVPEPDSWALLIIGFGTVGTFIRLSRRQNGGGRRALAAFNPATSTPLHS